MTKVARCPVGEPCPDYGMVAYQGHEVHFHGGVPAREAATDDGGAFEYRGGAYFLVDDPEGYSVCFGRPLEG